MASRKRVYIDATCFIEIMKHALSLPLPQDREREVSFVRMALEAGKARELHCLTSALTVAECLHVDGNLTPEAQRLMKSLLTSGGYVALVGVDPHIAEKARDLRWVNAVTGIRRGADYLHMASAIEYECEELLTLDKGVRTASSKLGLLGVRAVYPSETQVLSAERRQIQMFPKVEDLTLRKRRSKKET